MAEQSGPVRGGMKLQPALEFMTTYGWTIIIVGLALGMLAIVVSIPQTAIPPRCYFAYGVSCKGVIITTNQLNFGITNAQQNDLVGPTVVTVNLPPYATNNAMCNPSNVMAGGAMACNVILTTPIPIGAQISGTVTFNSSVCVTGNYQSCQVSAPVVYIGTFGGYAS